MARSRLATGLFLVLAVSASSPAQLRSVVASSTAAKRLLVSTLVGAGHTSASQGRSGGRTTAEAELSGCTAKGTVSYMFWGDKEDDAAHLASIKLAEKDCRGLKVYPIWDQGDYYKDLNTRVGSGNAPDLFQVNAPMLIPKYVAGGALAPLDGMVKEYGVNLTKTYWAQCINELTYKRTLYGLPRTCSNQSLLFYNKEMFWARRVHIPTDSWTYTDLAREGAKLSGTYSLPHDATPSPRFGIAQYTDDMRTEQFMWDWGGDWLSPDLKTCTMTSKQSRAGLRSFHDLSYKYHGMPTAAQAAGMPDFVSGFRKERYAMAFMGPWALHYAFGKASGRTPQINFPWGVVLTPRGPVSRQAVMASTGLVIYKKSKVKNAAFWLARFDSVGPGVVLMGAHGIEMPGAKALWNDPSIVKEYGKSALATIREGNKFGRSPRVVPSYDRFWYTVSHAMRPFWEGTVNVQQATSAACGDVYSEALTG